jgi:hypothetical protein
VLVVQRVACAAVMWPSEVCHQTHTLRACAVGGRLLCLWVSWGILPCCRKLFNSPEASQCGMQVTAPSNGNGIRTTPVMY